jgi:glycosyltransferase involved in cell wall biosynthesis
VGYAGAQGALRFDVELFCASARAIPEATFVLVGPADHMVASDIARRDLGNVQMLGPRPHAELGSYVTAFDVGIVPYRVNDFNLGSDPIKVYEYLALGKPVVSVPLPAVEELGEIVSIAAGHDQFIAAIRDALLEDRPDMTARRRAVAEAHSVEHIVDGLIAAFEEKA